MEPDIWTLVQAGNSRARDTVIESHIPLVHYLAVRMSTRIPTHIEVDDLFGYGIIGLIDAVDKFDPTRGVPFKTYANGRINGAIIDSLRRMDWAPRGLRRRIKSLKTTIDAEEQKSGHTPSTQEVADLTGLSVDTVNELAAYPTVQEVELTDTMAVEFDDTQVVMDEISHNIARALARIPKNDQLLIHLRYCENRTIQGISEVIGAHRSKACRLYHSAVIGTAHEAQNPTVWCP